MLKNMNSIEYKNRAKQMTYHDLRDNADKNESSIDFGCLLGLDLIFFCKTKDQKKEC